MRRRLFSTLLFALMASVLCPPMHADSVYELPQSKTLIEVAEKALPSVVFIAIERNWFDQLYAQNEDSYYQTFPTIFEWIRPLYESFYPAVHGHGSGFFIDEQGHIVTNSHVVGIATKVYVAVYGGKKRVYPATVVGKDFRSDLAVIKLETDEDISFPHVEFGDSSKLRLGEQVLAVGSPRLFQLESTFTQGIVSGLNRNRFCPLEIEGYIQTDCAIHGGNSGGPLFNLQGEVVGVNSSGIYGSNSLNFAIPSNTTKKIAHQLIEHGDVKNGFLGIAIQPNVEWVFDDYAVFDLPGVKVTKILKNSPASQMGLHIGDMIVAIDNFPIQSMENLRNYIYLLKPGTVVKLTVERNGDLIDLTATLEEDQEAILGNLVWHIFYGYDLVL